jgi:hypothetical protein
MFHAITLATTKRFLRPLEPEGYEEGFLSIGRGMMMLRTPILTLGTIALLLFGAAEATQAAEFGTADEAKALLTRGVTALKDDKTKALENFNSGNGGFKDRDLYVLCANASDGIITASPTSNGMNINDFPTGKNVMKTATENEVRETTYWWPRPGSIKPLKKHTFYTKVGDQICGVGYWEGSGTTHSQQATKGNSH